MMDLDTAAAAAAAAVSTTGGKKGVSVAEAKAHAAECGFTMAVSDLVNKGLDKIKTVEKEDDERTIITPDARQYMDVLGQHPEFEEATPSTRSAVVDCFTMTGVNAFIVTAALGKYGQLPPPLPVQDAGVCVGTAPVPPLAEVIAVNLFYRSSFGILWSPPKAGKTTLLSAAIVHISNNMAWLDKPVACGQVIILSEKPDDMIRNLRRWNPNPGLMNVHVTSSWSRFNAWCNAPPLNGNGEALPVVAGLVDTMAHVIVSLDLDENSTREVGRVARKLSTLASETGVGILAAAHVPRDVYRGGWQDRPRGIGDLEASVDYGLSIPERRKDDPEDYPTVVTHQFSREGINPSSFVVDKYGRTAAAPPKRERTRDGKPVDEFRRWRDKEAVILEVLHENPNAPYAAVLRAAKWKKGGYDGSGELSGEKGPRFRYVESLREKVRDDKIRAGSVPGETMRP